MFALHVVTLILVLKFLNILRVTLGIDVVEGLINQKKK